MVANVRGVEAVDRALRLLLAFRAAEPPLSLSELSERTGLHKSTVLRLSASLVDAGLVYRDAAGGFRLGAAVLALGSVFRSSVRIEAEIRPRLLELVRALGENASFFIREGRFRICVTRFEAPHTVRQVIREGERLPLDGTATGLVLRRSRAPTLLGLTGPFAPVFTTGINDPHTASMSSAVLDASGSVVGAITVSGPSFRFTQEAAERGAKRLARTAEAVSAQLGHALEGPTPSRVGIRRKPRPSSLP